MINVEFDGVEYFNFKTMFTQWSTSQNIALKEANFTAVPSSPFRDFLTILNKRNRMLASVYVNGKIYMEGFVTNGSIHYSDSPSGGTDIGIIIRDRFIGITQSDIVKTIPKNGSLQDFAGSILKELQYTSPEFIETYQRSISKASDFIKNGQGVTQQNLKSFKRKDLSGRPSASLLGEACSLSEVFIISNGFDTLTFEKPNSYEEPVFALKRGVNISFAEKTSDKAITPSRSIILNSKIQTKKNKESKTAILINYNGGIPHVQKIRHVNVEASYQELTKAIDFNFAGIRARENSFIYKTPANIFDKNGDFLQPNRLVSVFDEKYMIDENMAILQSGFTIDAAGGSNLVLNLTTQEAFDNNASIKQKRSLKKK